jgi:putative aldouronate transport system substrate-binding protein
MLKSTGVAAAFGAATAASPAFAAPATGSRRSSRAQSGETLKVSWAIWVQGPVDGDNLARQTILERFNIDLDMLAFERATWFDQLNTRVGGGDIPDIIYRDSPGVVRDYIAQGVLREVPYDAIKTSAPNAFAAANEFSTDVWLAAWKDGVNYGLPLLQPNQTRPWTNGWRLDWLDTLGIPMPQTIDEHREAYARILSDDPGGTGLSYGLGLRGKDSLHASIHAFTMAYGTTPSLWMQLEDGTLQHGATMDGARQALEHLAQWYSDQLIDPEFVTTDAISINQKYASGTIGYIPTTWYSLIEGGATYDQLMAVSPEAKVGMAPPPKGPDSLFGYMNWGPITSSVTFGKDVDDTKLERILEMLDAIETDPELAILLRFGNEGEHWQRNPETNAVIPTADYLNPANRGPLGTNFFAALPPSPAIQASIARSDEADLYAQAIAGNVKNFIPFATLLVPSEVTSQATEMDPTREKWLANFISGNESLDNWSGFLEEWNEAGGAAMTEAANATFPELQSVRADIATAVGAPATPAVEATPAS